MDNYLSIFFITPFYYYFIIHPQKVKYISYNHTLWILAELYRSSHLSWWERICLLRLIRCILIKLRCISLRLDIIMLVYPSILNCSAFFMLSMPSLLHVRPLSGSPLTSSSVPSTPSRATKEKEGYRILPSMPASSSLDFISPLGVGKSSVFPFSTIPSEASPP